jgi:surface antigen
MRKPGSEPMRAFTDEQLVAWVDGELPDDEARAIASAVESDAALAARVRPFRESRRVLEDAFAAQLREPVPARLLAALAEPVPVAARVSRMSRLKPLPQKTWLAMAASVVLAIGLAIGVGIQRPDGGGALALLPTDAESLNVALETLRGGEVLTRERDGVRVEVLPLGTLRTASGQWCRDFETTAQAAGGVQRSRGVACREDGRWEVQAVARLDAAPAPAGDDSYRAAGAGGVDVTAAVGAAERLTPEQEHARIQARWTQQ